MKKNLVSILFTVLIASAAIIGGVYAINGFRSGQGPEEAMQVFYTQWLTHEGNPLADKVYQDNQYVSREFSNKVDMIIASFDKGGYDPILCAQDIPRGMEIVNTSVKDDSAVLTVKEKFSGGDRMIEVVMDRVDDQWKIQDVVCQEGESQTGDHAGEDASPAIKNLVGDHIRENISDLSPEEAVLGGSFYVTSINFISPTECVVNYEDGHIALTAKAEFTVPAAGEVEIKSFELVEDREETSRTDNDFSEQGNIVGEDSDWSLVYEEPGKPALKVNLVFGPETSCADDDGPRPCLPPFWSNGDRVKVSGQITGNAVAVSNLIASGGGSSSTGSAPGSGNGICEDLCGDGTCQEMVCMAEGCPCAETPETCPEDCE
jgi:hypothetical protein